MILFENCVTNAHYFRIDVPECAGVCQRRRSAAHVRRCVYPRRCRGLTEGETARAVGMRRRVSRMRFAGRSGQRCATTGVGRWSAARTRFQLTPDSASGDGVEREICTARRCRCRCRAGVCQRRAPRRSDGGACTPDAVGG